MKLFQKTYDLIIGIISFTIGIIAIISLTFNDKVLKMSNEIKLSLGFCIVFTISVLFFGGIFIASLREELDELKKLLIKKSLSIAKLLGDEVATEVITNYASEKDAQRIFDETITKMISSYKQQQNQIESLGGAIEKQKIEIEKAINRKNKFSKIANE